MSRRQTEPDDAASTAGHLVLEASPNAIVAIDDQGRVIYANPQVATTFGYDHAELIGQPVD